MSDNLLIKEIENNQLRDDLLSFRTGDSVSVRIWVIESNKRRLQIFDGVVIAIRNRGFNSTFTVRKISYGEGVERVFQMHSPIIEKVIVKRCGKVRRAKLYYLRYCTGKHARIKERIG